MTRALAIGPSHPVLVIAEIGVNHDGSPARALELVHQAKAAGADGVKLQLFRASRLMHASCGLAGYQKSRVADATAGEMLRRYELSDAAVARISAEADKLKMWLIATPFSPGDLPLARGLELPAIKISSPDLVNKPFLRAAAKLGRPLLLSTGAATMEEVDQTVGWMIQWNAPFILLHCISSYPTPSEEANLGWIGELRGRYGIPVGYSDHTTEIAAGGMAVMAGARLVEKHLTHDRAAAGPDHAASLDGGQFADYVAHIRMAEKMLGQAGKHVLKIEQDVRRLSRQSVVLARTVARGAVVAAKDLTVQRPGDGIAAAEFDRFVGCRAVRKLRAGEKADWKMVRRSGPLKSQI